MKVEIIGTLPDDPRAAILAIEAATRQVCEATGKDPVEGIMMLLTAAAHLHTQYKKPGTDTLMSLAYSLGFAVTAADGFFQLRPVSREGGIA